MNVELGKDGRFADCVRVPMDWADNVARGADFDVFETRDATHVAYRAAGALYIVCPADSLIQARYTIMGLPGVLQGSLDTFRFKYAMMRELRARGNAPTMLASLNLVKLSQGRTR